MIVSIDVDAQKTFTPLCPKELPVNEGHLIVEELNAQAALADLRVMTKDAHELHPYGACFHDIEEKLSTGLIEWLRCQNTDTVIVGGLATDYCVKTTVLQLLKGGNWQVIVNEAACRGIAPDTIETAWQEMRSAGVMILKNAEEIKKYINNQ